MGTLLTDQFSISESVVAVCEFYAKGNCAKATACPLRHVRGDRTIVCKHWLRGLCKKGDHCEFLHEYDMTKMPECYFYSRFSKFNLKSNVAIRLYVFYVDLQVLLHNTVYISKKLPLVHQGICGGKTTYVMTTFFIFQMLATTRNALSCTLTLKVK